MDYDLTPLIQSAANPAVFPPVRYPSKRPERTALVAFQGNASAWEPPHYKPAYMTPAWRFALIPDAAYPLWTDRWCVNLGAYVTVQGTPNHRSAPVLGDPEPALVALDVTLASYTSVEMQFDMTIASSPTGVPPHVWELVTPFTHGSALKSWFPFTVASVLRYYAPAIPCVDHATYRYTDSLGDISNTATISITVTQVLVGGD